MKFIVFLLALAIHDITCADPSNPQSHFDSPEPTLACAEAGFSVSVVFGGTTLSQVGTITLGTAGEAECKHSDISITGTARSAANLILATKATIVYAAGNTATCGGTLIKNATTLGYTNELFIDVKETKGNAVVRVYRYQFKLTCTLTRQQTEAGSTSFTVDSTLQLEEAAGNKSDTFTLGVALNFLDDNNAVQGSDFTVDNFEMLNLRVAEDPGNEDYKFTVQSCFASQAIDPSDTTLVDNFIVNECPTDSTVTFTPGGTDQSEFLFQLRAFYLTGRESDAVYIHCVIFVCRADEDVSVYDDNCFQNTVSDCSETRKRRSVVEEEKTREPVFVSTTNSFTIAVSGVRCPEGYVFDSSIDECTNQRLILVKGVYLGLEWNPAYANVTSPAFKQFARTTSYQLEALIRNANKEHVIKGLRIVAARKGSVIIDVLITYGENVNAVKAFQDFEEVVLRTTPQMTRIVNMLNIRQDQLIEYVHVTANNNKTKLEIILIIVVVAALILIVFICGITLYRVKQARQGNATPTPAKVPNVFDNKAMESI